MEQYIPEKWKFFMKKEINSDFFREIERFLNKEYKEKDIFPKKEDIFSSLKYFDPKDTKVIIIGQDPYHTPNMAHGLAFSVLGQKIPPSLKNIYREIESDTKTVKDFSNGDLKSWAEQGVLLINSSLSVESGLAASHSNIGWEKFTHKLIQRLADNSEHLVFIAWGSHAIKTLKNINREKHLVLESVHPSPLSAYRGFFGSKHFSQTNIYLKNKKKKAINW